MISSSLLELTRVGVVGALGFFEFFREELDVTPKQSLGDFQCRGQIPPKPGRGKRAAPLREFLQEPVIQLLDLARQRFRWCDGVGSVRRCG